MKSQFKGMSVEDINKRLAEMRMQIMKLNSELAAKAQSKSVGQMRKLKKSIAQAETELSSLRNSPVQAEVKKGARQEKKDE